MALSMNQKHLRNITENTVPWNEVVKDSLANFIRFKKASGPEFSQSFNPDLWMPLGPQALASKM